MGREEKKLCGAGQLCSTSICLCIDRINVNWLSTRTMHKCVDTNLLGRKGVVVPLLSTDRIKDGHSLRSEANIKLP